MIPNSELISRLVSVWAGHVDPRTEEKGKGDNGLCYESIKDVEVG
jgi:hypothetical protein